MKLRFRIDPKDWKILIIFLIVLFYVVSLVVINAMAFLSEDIEYTILPTLAFTKEFFAPIMVFYIGIIIMVIVSTKDTIFNKEKGFGIEINEKKEKGYSKWAKEKDIKKVLKLVDPKADTAEAGGVPIINNGKELWVDAGEYHNLVIGSTGAGKTEILVQPMVKSLAKAGESMIITDPKGEIYEKNADELRKRGYNIILLNFRNPQQGNCWNPMALPYSLYKSGDIDKSNELLEDLAQNILYDEASKANDPFWQNTSADYFAGLSLALFEDAKEEEININSINYMSTVGEDKIKGTNTNYLKEYYSTKSPTSAMVLDVNGTLTAPTETKGSILSVFREKMKKFSTQENLSEMLSRSDFDMRDIGRKKTAVFIVIQDEKKTYHFLATIFLKQCYETLVSVAFEHGGKLPYKTNFILDEFANMPPLKDCDAMVTAARSRNIRFTFIIQNFAQLSDVYGKEKGETIKGNCGNIIYLISSEMAALEEISKMCGEEKSKKDDKTVSTPLVTVSDLQRFPPGTLLLLRIRTMPFKTKMKFNWEMLRDNDWGDSYAQAEYPTRDKQEVKLFDIKSVVEKLREEKINQIMGGPSLGMPGMPNDMFGMPSFGGPKKEPAGMPQGFDVDELVKRIDAKIAELEEEEKKEQEEKKKTQGSKIDSKLNQPIEQVSINEEKIIETPMDKKEDSSIEVNKKPYIEVNMPKEDVKDDITDDQFFDDFFYDEDE